MSTVKIIGAKNMQSRRAPIDYDGHAADVVLGAARDWSVCRTLPAEHREVFRALSDGDDVEASALNNAVIAALAANATRYGQSMDRRRGYAPLLAVSRWLAEQAGQQVPAREIIREVVVEKIEHVEIERPVTVEVEVDNPMLRAEREWLISGVLTEEQVTRLAAWRDGYAAAVAAQRVH